MRALAVTAPQILVRTAVAVAALVAHLSSAQAASQVTITDDFQGSSLYTDLWDTAVTNAGTAYQSGGKLVTATGTVAQQYEVSTADVGSLAALTGDFDVTVAYTSVQGFEFWTNAGLYVMNCDGQELIIYLARPSSTQRYLEAVYLESGTPVSYTSTSPGSPYDSRGSFRIGRSGNTVTAYWWNESLPQPDWQSLHSAQFTGPVRFHVIALRNNYDGASPDAASISWDNLSAVAQGVKACP